MQRIEPKTNGTISDALAPDMSRVARIVDGWATDRPILRDVSLFGERLISACSKSPIELAVRFDDRRMEVGFDDWIEQLRTNFAGLANALGEPVSVTTPDMGATWRSIVFGTERQGLATGKVRIISAPAELHAGFTRAAITRSQTIGSLWPANWQLTAGVLSRRPAH
jgi:hypothetical protein